MIVHLGRPDEQLPIACVTGASGMVGRRIVEKLLDRGYQIRVLTRRPYRSKSVRVFMGSLGDNLLLDEFINGADMVFHCAAELNDESKMREVNVDGTKRIIELIEKHRVKYFCYLSSAGVVGRTSQICVDEATPCRPQSTYERTKLEAENLAGRKINGCNTIILRPTNVVDGDHLGELHLASSGSLLSRLKTIIKGGECAHIVHAEDVAAAALYFLDRPPLVSQQLFFVSQDDDQQNTVACLWSLHQALKIKSDPTLITSHPHLPIWVPFILRSLMRQTGNRGNVRYSSTRLLSHGFRFTFRVRDIVASIFAEHK